MSTLQVRNSIPSPTVSICAFPRLCCPTSELPSTCNTSCSSRSKLPLMNSPSADSIQLHFFLGGGGGVLKFLLRNLRSRNNVELKKARTSTRMETSRLSSLLQKTHTSTPPTERPHPTITVAFEMPVLAMPLKTPVFPKTISKAATMRATSYPMLHSSRSPMR